MRRACRKTDGRKNEFICAAIGCVFENTVDAAESLGYKVILWSKDTIDWRDRDQSLIYRRATEDIAGGDLVLMHPTAETASALPSILSYYREQALEIVPVSENISGLEKA